MDKKEAIEKLQYYVNGSLTLTKETSCDLYFTLSNGMTRANLRVNLESQKVFENNRFSFYLF